ncbi:AMP-binding protein [bacterium]|nr:AMP-binding protein [bacterium]
MRSKTQSEIKEIQSRLLQATVAFVFEHSAYYREHLSAAGVHPSDITSVDDLCKIPCTSKDDFSNRTNDFLCAAPEDIVDITTTSGTSGAPVMIKLTAQDMARLAHNEALAFEQVGVSAQDTVALAVTLDRCFMAGMAYFQGLSRLGAAAIRVGSGSPAMLLKMVERAQATVMMTVPSFLKRITAYAQANGVDLHKNAVRKIICIGEPIRERDFSLNPLCARLAKDWNADLYSTYGSTEIEGSFCECERGCGGHVQPGHMLAEIITPQGDPVAPGEIGELCVTPFGIRAMPVLRYRTGDYTFMNTQPCACGRVTPRIGPILGRRDQMLKIKGTTIFPGVIHHLIQRDPAIQAYVLIVESDDPLSDKLTLLVDAGRTEAVERLRESIRSEIKVTPEIKMVSAREIQELQTAGDYRKRRMFIDKRQLQ